MATKEQLSALLGKKTTLTPEIVDLAARLLSARRQVEEAEASLKDAKALARKVEEELLRVMDEAGLKTLTGKTADLQAVTSDHFAVDRATLSDNGFVLWLARQGGMELLERAVNASSFSHWCQDVAARGKPLHGKIKKVTRRYIRQVKK